MKKPRREKLYSNPVAQSVTRKKVMDSLKRIKMDAELQAYAGGRVAEMVSDACMLLFAVAFAWHIVGVKADSPDARIMRGMANALADLAAHPNQIEIHRPSIQSGLAAIERVLPSLDPLAIGVGMVECKNLIAGNGIGTQDIHNLLGAAA